ncbi:MAG: Tol-Pal system beta propeller repeat protein TolB [Pseudomonadota bacterium]
MQRFLSLFLFLTLWITSDLCTTAYASLNVDITQGTMAPTPIAITNFIAGKDASSETQVALDVTKVLTNDLKNSGLFRPIDPAAFIQDSTAVNGAPRFADWRLLQAQALVVGKVTEMSGDQFRVDFRLFDVFAEQQIEGLSMTFNKKDWRRAAHKIADAIYQRMTGEKGYFDTRITYVSETGAGKKKRTRIAVMDQDGANHHYLTRGDKLTLTPRFSPTVQQITFMDYGLDGKTPRVKLMNLKNKSVKVIGKFKNMTFAPRFLPDGNRLIFSLSDRGNSSLYMVNLGGGTYQRLTYGSVIDTSGSVSPDGRQVVFNSDRGGTQQLYVMNIDGSGIHRISFGDGRYATPVWSPRGDLIAFTKMYQGSFYIGVIKPDGTGERLIAQGYLVEEPTWAPNGRVLMYTRSDRGRGRSQLPGKLYMVDITGHNERIIPTPRGESAVSPSWSPLIP